MNAVVVLAPAPDDPVRLPDLVISGEGRDDEVREADGVVRGRESRVVRGKGTSQTTRVSWGDGDRSRTYKHTGKGRSSKSILV